MNTKLFKKFNTYSSSTELFQVKLTISEVSSQLVHHLWAYGAVVCDGGDDN